MLNTGRSIARRSQYDVRERMHMMNIKMLKSALLASGCATKQPSSPPPSVAPPRTTPLSPEAEQPPAPWCSPTCSHGLMLERESWRKRMTEPK